jgi:protein transport protein SEC31
METMQPLSQPVPSNTSSVSTANQLKIPPKWLKKPCGARFGFGGKLVTFDFDSSNAQTENQSAQPNQQSQNTLQKHSGVFVSKVVTEPDLVQKSLQLETSLKNENLAEFCNLKIAESSTKEDQQIWKFIRANFSDNPNNEFLELLGYNPEQIRSQICSVAGMLPANALSLHGEQLPNSIESSMDQLTNTMEGLGNSVKTEDEKDTTSNTKLTH